MKKMLLVLLMLALMLSLTACKCKHEETHVLNAKEATCTEEGYSGDTVCVKCEEVVTAGAAIAATGHTEGELQNAAEPTCTEEGYTGDAYCTVCEEQLVQGEAIPAVGHTEGELQNVVEATCTQEGYTGDAYCTVCGEQLVQGEVVAMLPHTEGEVENAIEPTCTELGYTGDTFCTVCGAYVTHGSSLPELGHNPGEPVNAVEPTCLTKGYTGDFPCTRCDEILSGEEVAKLEHTYENDVCTVCGWRTPGLYIGGVLEFTWDEIIATGYVKMHETILVSVSEGLHGDLVVGEEVTELHGKAFERCQLSKITLPVDCSVMGQQVFDQCKALEEIVFFNAPEEIKDAMFRGCENLMSIVIPESVTVIGDRAFENCASLEKVVLPNGVTKIGQYAFKNCTALSQINVPASLQILNGSVFENCLSLTSFDLPEGFQLLAGNTFTGSAVTHLTIPSTVTTIATQKDADSLVFVDMSRMPVQQFRFGDLFKDCDALKEIIFPEGLIALEANNIQNCCALEEIVLPDTLMTFKGYDGQLSGCNSVTRVVWPVALNDGSAFADLPALTEICFRGSELQWSMTVSKDLFENVNIIYDYEG